MLNHVVLMGRLTRDPEVRHTQSGIPVASFTLAVDRDYGPKGADKQADFINIVAWRNTAEFVGKYFGRGQLVAVSGRLQVRDYTDQSGQKRYFTEVVADNVYFAEPKRDRAPQQYGGDQYGQQSYGQNQYQSQNQYQPQSQPQQQYGGYQQAAPTYEQQPQYQAYTTPVSTSDFAELDDDDSDLPF
jgi:single-strand DNA-binding protein